MLRKSNRRIPTLIASPRVDGVMLWVSGVSVFLFVLFFVASWVAFGATSLSFSISVLLIWIAALCIANARLSTHLPLGIETLDDLARAVAPVYTHNGCTSAGERLLAQVRILEETRALVAKELALPLERVRPESDFIMDLGCG
ncbi:MAG: hypothetical protein IPK69_13275 [Phycisphaerales bacterium]|nr:MAG: hypothetical protein IPK69_13275 [Phycisphaerales bacterium]